MIKIGFYCNSQFVSELSFLINYKYSSFTMWLLLIYIHPISDSYFIEIFVQMEFFHSHIKFPVMLRLHFVVIYVSNIEQQNSFQ